MTQNTYSFLDVQATLSGPSGSFGLGQEAQPAEEGISYAFTEDKGTLTVGAGGAGMHSLHAGKSGTITVRLLKTSPVNALLSAAYNLQTASSAIYGNNTLTVRDSARGDFIVGRQAAFRKMPDNAFSKVGNMLEWVFNCVALDVTLGDGNPTSAFGS